MSKRLPSNTVQNQSDTAHRAPGGSLVTIFVTGMGATSPAIRAGSIATGLGIRPVNPVYSPWYFGVTQSAQSVPAFISSMFQLRLRVPSVFSGTIVDPENGRVALGITTSAQTSRNRPPASNAVWVYVK